jgi:predicted ATPase
MGQPIDKITIKGFKSIKSLEDFPLTNLNILIGANGAGKSNFVSFFTLLREVVEGRLRPYVAKKGGAADHLFMGPEVTKEIYTHLQFQSRGYGFRLEPTIRGDFFFGDEWIRFDEGGTTPYKHSLGKGHYESELRNPQDPDVNLVFGEPIRKLISQWVVYHLHDTSEMAPMRRPGSVRDNDYLRPDASNLAAFLLRVRGEQRSVYDEIKDTIRLAAPFFDDFKLRPKPSNGDESLQLEWTQKDSDYPFHVSQLSDGTLRFIALTTALLQPNLPTTILFDEPELGLHPYALNLLAAMLKEAATKTQVIVSTQSASLLDSFEAEDVIVVERDNGASTFERPSAEKLQEWLKDYSLGELWEKNIFGGNPSNG